MKSRQNTKVEEYREKGFFIKKITSSFQRVKKSSIIVMLDGNGGKVAIDYRGELIPDYVEEDIKKPIEDIGKKIH